MEDFAWVKERSFSRVLGNKYNRLEVIDDLIYWEVGKRRKVLCRCSCSDKTEKLVGLAQLINGNTKSCGCIQKEITVARNFKHGYSERKNKDPLYDLWGNMCNRCLNEDNESYKNYGGRNITICDKWRYNSKNFIEWCLENGWEKGLTIDRVNNDGNYEPGNCQFVTRQVNNENRRLLQDRNKSGYRGVYKRRYNFTARIVHKNKTILDKSGFKTAKEAALARDIFCIKNGIPFALNFPELAFSWCL